jgi:hypothetical protein
LVEREDEVIVWVAADLRQLVVRPVFEPLREQRDSVDIIVGLLDRQISPEPLTGRKARFQFVIQLRGKRDV